MQKAKRKPKWAKPKLIVLVRGKPQEVVLDACKDGIGGDPSNGFAGCWDYYVVDVGCPTCSEIGSS